MALCFAEDAILGPSLILILVEQVSVGWLPRFCIRALGVVLPSGLRCQHSLAGHLDDLAGHDGVDDGVVDVRQALN